MGLFYILCGWLVEMWEVWSRVLRVFGINGVDSPSPTSDPPPSPPPPSSTPPPKTVLNVGGQTKSISLPTSYEGWRQVLLDVTPGPDVDVVLDARELEEKGAPAYFDAVYCSHTLEHFPAHDVDKVLRGFRHVVKPNGHIHIRVPDLRGVMYRYVNGELTLDGVLYVSPSGPIKVRDVLFGHEASVKAGHDAMSHRTGFDAPTLMAALKAAGFGQVTIVENEFELEAVARIARPILNGYDLDGVLTHGCVPEEPYVVISGRTSSEFDDTVRAWSRKARTEIREDGLRGDREHAGRFKAQRIAALGVTRFFDDDPVQAQIIREGCPDVEVVVWDPSMA